jgi:hypothetical protein
MAKLFSARQAGEELDLEHLEVIRRIRRGDIEAKKLGWNWVITEAAIEAARSSAWFVKLQARRASTSAE